MRGPGRKRRRSCRAGQGRNNRAGDYRQLGASGFTVPLHRCMSLACANTGPAGAPQREAVQRAIGGEVVVVAAAEFGAQLADLGGVLGRGSLGREQGACRVSEREQMPQLGCLAGRDGMRGRTGRVRPGRGPRTAPPSGSGRASAGRSRRVPGWRGPCRPRPARSSRAGSGRSGAHRAGCGAPGSAAAPPARRPARPARHGRHRRRRGRRPSARPGSRPSSSRPRTFRPGRTARRPRRGYGRPAASTSSRAARARCAPSGDACPAAGNPRRAGSSTRRSAGPPTPGPATGRPPGTGARTHADAGLRSAPAPMPHHPRPGPAGRARPAGQHHLRHQRLRHQGHRRGAVRRGL